MGKFRYQFRGALTSYGSGLVLSLVAIGLTYYVPLFTRIPWTLSFCAVAMVAWIGGVPAALMTAVITGCGISALVLVPGSPRQYELASLAQAIAFFLIALLIAYLVSQRNRALASLKESETHYRSVTETASDVILTIDSDSCILGINPAVKTMFGYEPSELVGKKMLVLMPERYRAAHTAGIERHLATGVRHIAWTGVQLPGQCKDGQEIPLEVSFGSYSARGQRRFTGFIRNISDRQKTEVALMHSEKLAAVGRLASSIAHEINNPLEAVTNLLFLSRGSADLAEVHSYLDTAEREVRRISVIANQTLQFHKHSGKPSEVLCEALIAGSLALYQGKLANAALSVEQRQRANRPAVCVEGEIRQVLNNLIGNAIDALSPHHGRLLFRSRNATGLGDGTPGVVLTIADTGKGMSPATQAHIFEAFFTTKGIGGAGLGLWISSQLVEQNHGRIRFRSSVRSGRSGTVFTLFLPSPPDTIASP